MLSEGASISRDVPPHVVGLTSGGRNNTVFLLDTDLGIIHFVDCPNGIKYDPDLRESVQDDPYG